MMHNVGLDGSALGAGWRVLRRHLRYASGNPRKLWWIARRALQIIVGGHLRGVLQRHRVVENFYRDYPQWVKAQDKLAEDRHVRVAAAAEQWPVRPRLSILLPVYCPSMAFLELAIESVLSQRYPHWELCIVDDASPDAAHLPLLEDLTRRDPRVLLQRRAKNGGIALATNDALAAATGDYCVFLDQDDLLANGALIEIAARAVENPRTVIIYGDEDRIDAAGVRSRPMFKPDWDPEWLRTTNYVMHPVAVRTSSFRDIGGLRTGLDGVQDWDLLLRVAERADA
ncbi:MAG: glycosyltransferase, partial [Burkholderiales bacterium]